MTGTPPSGLDLAGLAAQQWFGALADRGLIVTDRALVVRAWNPWMASLTGIPAENALRRRLVDIVPSIAARGMDEHYQRALQGEARILAHRFHRFLIPASRSAGANAVETVQSARVLPLVNEGSVVGTITIIEDVAERVTSERELRAQIANAERARVIAEDASRLKDDFLATMSHEIRTPLNAVLGWTQILRTHGNSGSYERGLEVIARNATSQLRLVEDLLDMARIVSGKLRLVVSPVDVQAVVQAAVDVVLPAASAKQVTLHTRAEAARTGVNADVDRLQQAIWNVLANAVKFTPAGGVVEVTVRREGSVVCIVVTDTGQGIGAEFLPYVFDRFRQADSSTSRRHGGLGLGLALTQQIVQLHGGFIDAHSDGVERGSRFTIRLPVSEGAVAALSPAAGFGDSALHGIKVLLVEDSVDGREMLEIGLRGYGATVIALDSGDAAIEVLSSASFVPDVLVSDIAMPGTDGYSFIKRVKTLPEPMCRTPAIALTAYAEAEDRMHALAAGYQLHLRKPIDPVQIVDSILMLVSADRMP